MDRGSFDIMMGHFIHFVTWARGSRHCGFGLSLGLGLGFRRGQPLFLRFDAAGEDIQTVRHPSFQAMDQMGVMLTFRRESVVFTRLVSVKNLILDDSGESVIF